MAKFLAVTSRGLSDVLALELGELGYTVVDKNMAGVSFEGNWEDCYRANLQLRTATRILKPLLDFPAYQPEDLYHNIKKHDFTKYIHPHQTFTIDASVRDSSFHDQRFVAMKIKDGIADQFREKFDARPDIDNENPDLVIMVRVVKNQVSVSLDTTGSTMSMRGYRTEAGEAPLREHLAAGLLKMAGWTPDIPLVDPMCGSGTFIIEAALQMRKIQPGTFRKQFAFQRLRDFKPEIWDKVVTEQLNQEVESEEPKEGEASPVRLFGFDKDSKVIKISQRNAARAGVENDVVFKTGAVDMLEKPIEKGMIILNPPYGERLGVTEELKDVYKDLAYILKRNFQGWSCWILSGNEELTKSLKLKATRRIPVWNGNIECRFLEYKINA